MKIKNLISEVIQFQFVESDSIFTGEVTDLEVRRNGDTWATVSLMPLDTPAVEFFVNMQNLWYVTILSQEEIDAFLAFEADSLEYGDEDHIQF